MSAWWIRRNWDYVKIVHLSLMVTSVGTLRTQEGNNEESSRGHGLKTEPGGSPALSIEKLQIAL